MKERKPHHQWGNQGRYCRIMQVLPKDSPFTNFTTNDLIPRKASNRRTANGRTNGHTKFNLKDFRGIIEVIIVTNDFQQLIVKIVVFAHQYMLFDRIRIVALVRAGNVRRDAFQCW